MACPFLASALSPWQFGWVLIASGLTLLGWTFFKASLGDANVTILRGWRITAVQSQDSVRFARYIRINVAGGIVAMLVGLGVVLFV